MMKGGEVGGVIAASATAEIALRLVKENSPRTMVDRVLAHIRKQGYFVVDKEPDTATLTGHPRIAKVVTRAAGIGAWRTDPDVPEARFVTDALRSRYGEGLVRIRTLGGAFPPTGSSTLFTCRPWAYRSRTSTTTSTPTTRISAWATCGMALSRWPQS